MRFDLSYNLASRILLTLLGAGPGKGYVDVTDDTVHVRLGWSGSISMRRKDIASVEQVDRIPWWFGLGMHGDFRGGWAINGAVSDAVKISMEKPSSGRVLFFPIRATTIYMSLEEPSRFVDTLSPDR